MSPAFSSPRQAAAFAGLLFIFLLLPVVVPERLLPPREQSYQTESWGSGPYPWIHHVIFEEKGDIDIAFVGSSHMFRGIDTPLVQAELSKKLGRPAVVRTIAWGGAGYDALFFIVRDLLEHRNVRCLVFYDENNFRDQRNVQGTSWFRWAENSRDLAGLPLVEKARFYLVGLLGMPRTILAMIRPNVTADLSPAIPHEQEVILHAPNPVTRLGSFPAYVGYNQSADTYAHAEFTPYTPDSGTRPEQVMVYSESTKEAFRFATEPLPEWQTYFARKFADVAGSRGSKLILLSIPTFYDREQMTVQERAFWPDTLRRDLTMIGIPPARLFQNMSADDVLKLYSDWGHFNKNGMEYFTRLITPALLQVYETAKRP